MTDNLPELLIKIEGGVTQSNFEGYSASAIQVIDDISTTLLDDMDFAEAEDNCKWLLSVETKLVETSASVIAQTADIEVLIKGIETIRVTAREKRLQLGKLIKAEKTAMKAALLYAAAGEIKDNTRHCNSLIKPYTIDEPNMQLADAIKGKRTIKAMKEALNASVAMAKEATDILTGTIMRNRDYMTDEYKALFFDANELVQKSYSEFTQLYEARVYRFEKEREEAARVAEEKKQAEIVAQENQHKEDLRKAEERRELDVAEAAAYAKTEAENKARLAMEEVARKEAELKRREAASVEREQSLREAIERDAEEKAQAEKQIREDEENKARLISENAEHRRAINNQILNTLTDRGMDPSEAMQLIIDIAKDRFDHLKIVY